MIQFQTTCLRYDIPLVSLVLFKALFHAILDLLVSVYLASLSSL